MNIHYWTAEEEAELRALFEQGVIYEAIANRFDLSRNAVIAKLHRMGLRRASVVRPKPAEPPIVPQRAGRSTLPPLPSLAKGNERG